MGDVALLVSIYLIYSLKTMQKYFHGGWLNFGLIKKWTNTLSKAIFLGHRNETTKYHLDFKFSMLIIFYV